MSRGRTDRNVAELVVRAVAQECREVPQRAARRTSPDGVASKGVRARRCHSPLGRLTASMADHLRTERTPQAFRLSLCSALAGWPRIAVQPRRAVRRLAC